MWLNVVALACLFCLCEAQFGPCGDPLFFQHVDQCKAEYPTNENAVVCQKLLKTIAGCQNDWPFDFPNPFCSGQAIASILKGRIDERCLPPWDSQACLGGFFAPVQDEEHISFVLPCVQGMLCPHNWMCIIPCSEGGYCPSPGELRNARYASNEDNHCVPDAPCCEPYGHPPLDGVCGGASVDFKCPEGYYCPAPDGKTVVCPAGHFCREGSRAPQQCPLLSVCKEGTVAPVTNFIGISFDAGVLVVGAVSIFAYKYTRWIKQTCQAPVDDKTALAEANHENTPLNAEASVPRKDLTVRIDFEDLGLELKGPSKKRVLNGVTGTLRPGRVAAVMGPSGAGKTTFLSTLCGKAHYGNMTGVVKINGEVVPIQEFKRITGFVPQEDVMHRTLTVREVLNYQAKLRLPKETTAKERQKRVDDVIKLLDLQHIQDSIIGDEESRGVSGGQRKRVNIGMELVADPTLLFLDEPTSGLDSTSSFLVLQALRKVAEEGGLTIVTVLHQPRYEIFQMFHDVVLLGPGGRTVYLGDTAGALPFFESLGFQLPQHSNPADFFMDVISGSVPCENNPEFTSQTLFDAWAERSKTPSPDSAVLAEDISPSVSAAASVNAAPPTPSANATPVSPRTKKTYVDRESPSAAKQTWFFFQRAVVLQSRILPTLALDLFLSLFAGSVLGVMFLNAELPKHPGLNSMNSLVIGLVAMLRASRTFSNERVVFWRESASGVNPLAYFLGFNFAQVPMMVINPFVYLSLFYTLTSPRALFVDVYFLVMITEFACVGLGNMIAALFNPRNTQMAIVVTGLISAMLSGNMPTLATLHNIAVVGPLCSSLSFARWLVEGLFETEVTRYAPVWRLDIQALVTHFGFGIEMDSTGEITSHCYAIACVVLVIFGVLSRVLAFAAMVYTHRGEQQ